MLLEPVLIVQKVLWGPELHVTTSAWLSGLTETTVVRYRGNTRSNMAEMCCFGSVSSKGDLVEFELSPSLCHPSVWQNFSAWNLFCFFVFFNMENWIDSHTYVHANDLVLDSAGSGCVIVLGLLSPASAGHDFVCICERQLLSAVESDPPKSSAWQVNGTKLPQKRFVLAFCLDSSRNCIIFRKWQEDSRRLPHVKRPSFKCETF